MGSGAYQQREIEYIRARYPSDGPRAVAAHLGRSVQSIKSRASLLKVRDLSRSAEVTYGPILDALRDDARRHGRPSVPRVARALGCSESLVTVKLREAWDRGDLPRSAKSIQMTERAKDYCPNGKEPSEVQKVCIACRTRIFLWSKRDRRRHWEVPAEASASRHNGEAFSRRIG